MTKPHEVRTFRFVTSWRNWFARCDIPHIVVNASASITIRLLIFESPYSRSMKVIGTSTDPKSGLQRPPGEINLEAVACRCDIVQAQPEQRLMAEHGIRRLRRAAGYRA